MPDIVGEDDKHLGDVERCAGAIKLIGELRHKKAAARPARAVQDEHGIVDFSLRIATRGAKRCVADPEFGQCLPACELEILVDCGLFLGLIGPAGSGGCRDCRGEECDQSAHMILLAQSCARVKRLAPPPVTIKARATISEEAIMARAFIFPGQGSQAVGMGSALAAASPVAREVFQEVDDALGQNLFRLMTEGPEDQLTLTENAQPAIMANAIATLHVLEREGGVRLADKAAAVAGHSLGEYTALCAAGALDLATTARLLKTRGQAMQAAVPVGVGAMAALLGADIAKAQALADAAADGEVCTVANDNDPGQVVISGHKAAIDRAIALVKDHGIKRGVLLPVSAPFHCPLMQPAADAMAEALAGAAIDAPFVPVYANVTAAAVADPEEIKRLLVEQVTGRVRWRESVAAMFDAGLHDFVELGGKIVAPMVKRTAPDAEARSVMTMDDIEALLKTI
jgi:[acyl-carrier-protein] S-malonyltransferase